MGVGDVLVIAISLLGLFFSGLKFVQHSVYRDYENRNPTARIMFAVVFALSASMLELLVFEIIDFMSPG